jgi:hypothetical protein
MRSIGEIGGCDPALSGDGEGRIVFVRNGRVPDAVQRAKSAFTRVFDVLWLHR